MLKCKINKTKGFVKVKANGNPHDLAVETCTIIEECYRELHKQNPEAAAEYKHTTLTLMLAPGSPVWKEAK